MLLVAIVATPERVEFLPRPDDLSDRLFGPLGWKHARENGVSHLPHKILTRPSRDSQACGAIGTDNVLEDGGVHGHCRQALTM